MTDRDRQIYKKTETSRQIDGETSDRDRETGVLRYKKAIDRGTNTSRQINTNIHAYNETQRHIKNKKNELVKLISTEIVRETDGDT